MKLTTKIAAAFILTVMVTFIAMIAGLRHFVYRDFTDYVNRVELERMNDLLTILGATYREHNDWQKVRDNPELWRRLITPSSAVLPEDPGRSPGRHANPPHPPPAGYNRRPPPGLDTHGPPPGRDIYHIGPRLFLLDRQQATIIGRPGPEDQHLLSAIEVDGQVAGWLGLRKRPPLQSPLETAFITRQNNLFFILGGSIFIITVIVSLGLSRHILAPVKQLASAAQAITARRFETRVQVSTRDELGQLAADFNHMAATLNRFETMRRQWLSDIAHELRTPLAVLQGEIEALQDGVRPLDQEALSSLHGETLQIGKLIHDLHQLSLADSGALQMEKVAVNPIDVLNEAVGRFQPRFERRGIRVIAENGENALAGISVMGDAGRLRQIVSNLLENCLRYADAPGTISHGHRLREGWITLFIEDSGPGVPAPALPRLFDRLYRVDRSRSRTLGGSGLGLSICQSIVEHLGGRIRALNGASGGLRIEIDLPLV